MVNVVAVEQVAGADGAGGAEEGGAVGCREGFDMQLLSDADATVSCWIGFRLAIVWGCGGLT